MLRSTLLLFLISAASPSADRLYFPSEDADWQRIAPAKAGWDARALDTAIDFAGARRSSAVVILYRGSLLAERQWDPAKQKKTARYAFERTAEGLTVEDVASTQKSVAAVLFGIAQHHGLIHIDDPASRYLGGGWSKAAPEQEKRITMRHLLSMTSGLTDALAYEAEPGTKWRYNSYAYQKIMPALARASGKSENDLTREWLTAPIGMKHSHWRERPQLPGMLGFMTTARDLARFGLMVEAGGTWNGRAIVQDRDWMRRMLDSSQSMNPSYGYLWWLNGRPSVSPAGKRSAKLIPTAPDDLVAALGALGRKVYVVPSLGIVATRIGDNSDLAGEPPFDSEFWRLLMQAAPRAH